MHRLQRVLVPVLAAAAALVVASPAFAHARMNPAVSLANELQLYSLAVPTEKANAKTTKVVLTLPDGFSIDSFVPNPGWTRSTQQSKVTWTGGTVPTGEDALFQFLAQPKKAGTYTFQVQQTLSDGSIVNWTDSETGQDPAPSIDVVSSVGGGGTSTLSIVALVLGAVGILVGAVALASRSGRQLA